MACSGSLAPSFVNRKLEVRSFIALHTTTLCCADIWAPPIKWQELLLRHGCVCWVRHKRKEYSVNTARAAASARREHCVMAVVSARRAAVLCYVCCYSCCASQKRINTSAKKKKKPTNTPAVPAVLTSSCILQARTLPTLRSANSADDVSNKTSGTVNRMKSSTSTKDQIPSSLLLQHPTGCCPKHGGNSLTSTMSAFQPWFWG